MNVDTAIERMKYAVDGLGEVSALADAEGNFPIGELEVNVGAQKGSGQLGKEKHNWEAAVPIAGIASVRRCPGALDDSKDAGGPIPVLFRDTFTCPQTVLRDRMQDIDQLIPQRDGKIGETVDHRLPADDPC